MRSLAVAICCAALWLPGTARAYTTCQNTVYGTLCTAQVDFSRFAQTAFQTQQQTQWCWAASIAMLFSYHGHPVSQSRLVTEAYGSIANVPAPGSVMAQQLNRNWNDDQQQRFSARLTGAYDPQYGVSTLDNNRLISELDQGRPFVMGTGGHAVVVTAMQYYITFYGPSVAAVVVFDPWPGRGARTLSVTEATPVEQGGSMTFIATAQVSSTQDGSAANNPFGSGGGASGGVMLLGLALGLALLAWVQRRGG